GICQDVLNMKINGQDIYFSYNPSSGTIVWLDSATMTPSILAPGSYSVLAEGGDYAGYKVNRAWSFTVSASTTDHSAPAIAQKSPIGMAGSDLPEISVRVFDNQSGIVAASIVMTLDGVAVVDSSNIGTHYDPSDGTVSYTPAFAFIPGTPHTVTITARHWASFPADKITSSDVWAFNVP
ncbi:MAG: hypothetical protein ABIG11_08330, partial [bacterium]